MTALARAVQHNAPHLSSEHICSEILREVCLEAEQLGCGDGQFWDRVCSEIATAYLELSSVRESLKSKFSETGGNRDQEGELHILCGLCRGCIHVGIVISQLLLPTTIDPVTLREVHYNCYQTLVSDDYLCYIYVVFVSLPFLYHSTLCSSYTHYLFCVMYLNSKSLHPIAIESHYTPEWVLCLHFVPIEMQK